MDFTELIYEWCKKVILDLVDILVRFLKFVAWWIMDLLDKYLWPKLLELLDWIKPVFDYLDPFLMFVIPYVRMLNKWVPLYEGITLLGVVMLFKISLLVLKWVVKICPFVG